MNATEAGNPIDAHIGARIEMRRKALGLTREAVAKALGLAAHEIEGFESGSARAPADMLFEVAALFDVKVAYFFDSDIPGAGPGRDTLRELNRAN